MQGLQVRPPIIWHQPYLDAVSRPPTHARRPVIATVHIAAAPPATVKLSRRRFPEEGD